jgi:tricorn protease
MQLAPKDAGINGKHIRRGVQRFGLLAGILLTLLIVVVATPGIQGESGHPLILRSPTLSKADIAFASAGYIWIVPRDGGGARQLTIGGHESYPIFSPDGSQITFEGEYNGNPDVYTIPAAGGEPTRLTYHPGQDSPISWTPDGKRILFVSNRSSATDPTKFFTISATGDFPQELLLPMAFEGSYSPDGTKLAYVPNFQWQDAWKRYRGGQTKPIWIVRLSDSEVMDRIPRENSNDFNPLWVGNRIFFLSDRNRPVSLFAYDLASKQVTEVIHNEGLDFKSASAGPGGIVIEQFGKLLFHDLESGKTHEVHVRIASDLPEVRPHFEKIKPSQLRNADISPTGVRAVFEARGEIFTVPAEKGDARNITNTVAVAERDPSWSPDGKSIAYFSDASGEYALHISSQNGIGDVKKISLGNPPSFFYSPLWAPDSSKVAYSDKRLNLWYLDVANPSPVKVDTDLYDSPLHEFDAQWSPDGKWIAYTKQLPNHERAAFVYSLDDKKATQVTDGMSDVLYPVWDKNGKYLYFTASTNMALSAGWLDMTSEAHPVTRSVYVTVLAKDLPSPLAPESDEEKAPDTKKADQKDSSSISKSADADKDKDAQKDKDADKDKDKDKEKDQKPVKVTIDFDNLGQRILALPIPEKNYVGLVAGKEGVLFLGSAPVVSTDPDSNAFDVERFDLKTRKTEAFVEGATQTFTASHNGEKLLYNQGDNWFIVPTEKAPKAGDGKLKTDQLEVKVDPLAEWNQMYHEVWRIERDFFYDPNSHGLNLEQAENFYRPYLRDIRSRDDLNYLFEEMLGNITVGHMFIRGGDMPEPPKVKGGLLGADYSVDNGRYRFTKVYSGENWNPQLMAPLTQPGVNVKAGEYLIAVNGRELHATNNIYSFFEETAGKQVVIKVGPNADGSGSRDATVVPIANEFALRNRDWIESNRRKVDELSGGKLAYIYLPNTAEGGFTYFNRYFFSQVGKQGAVIDERFNHGGQLADYVVDYLRRPLLSWVLTREGQPFSSPQEAIYGPKVMIINQFAGSGGDALPWYFRKLGVGPLVGVRTWGGLVGIGGYPELMDGGRVTAPRWAIYGLNGEWEVENHGIAPDFEVEMDPKLAREGHDPQLEKAVAVALELLKKNPRPQSKVPDYPNYHQQFPTAP